MGSDGGRRCIAPPDARALRRATAAVSAVFILSGFAFASWASRIPQVRDNLELSPRQLGLVLLAIAVGSVISMPVAIPLRIWPRRKSP